MVFTVPPVGEDRHRLLLFRHAKSDWGNVDLSDIDRPLNARGRKAAATMGQFMRAQRLIPELVLCSAAVRTRETLDIAFEGLAKKARKPVVRFETELYLASPDRILRFIRDCKPDVSSLMIIGHNPGMELLALQLAAAADDSTVHERLGEKFPTAALAVIDVPQWDSVEEASGQLVAFITPRQLASDDKR